MAEADHVPFHEGQDAYERGEGVLACPYGTLLEGKRLSWLAGWDEARRYAEHRLATRDGSEHDRLAGLQ